MNLQKNYKYTKKNPDKEILMLMMSLYKKNRSAISAPVLHTHKNKSYSLTTFITCDFPLEYFTDIK